MTFGWINGINAVAVIWLIIVNILAVKKGIAGSMESRYTIINVCEQIGRYGCMTLMILPIAVSGWGFGFTSVAEMLIWICVTMIILIVYSVLWTRKKFGSKAVLYGLAILPVCLFLINGVLLRHWLLIVFSLLFGFCHLWIVSENIKSKTV